MQNIRRLQASLILAMQILCSITFAEWTSKNRLELGLTDNALLSTNEKESDVFLFVATKNSFLKNGNTLGFRLGYTDFNKVNSNDSLNWGVFDRLRCFSNSNCYVELKGVDYTSGEPMTTDSSFNSQSLLLTIESSRDLTHDTSLDLETSYEARVYPSISRTDHSLNQSLTYSYDLSKKVYLEALGNIGILGSSDSDYSNYNFSLSGIGEYTLGSDLKATAEIGIKQTQFLSRTVTTQTQVTRKRGQTISTTDTSKERYSTNYISAGIEKELSPNSLAGLSLEVNHQNSVSGYQDYSELKFLAKVLINF